MLSCLVFALLAADPPAAPPLFPSLPAAEAWTRLPQERPALPIWALTLAEAQPRTTAGVLELDRLHRSANPLGNRLAAQVREAVAAELKCEYARRYAAADLARLQKQKADEPELNPEQKTLILRLSRKLTSAGYTLTDAEFAQLLAILGEERAVAWVHTVAFANFHFRILLALGVTVEDDGPYPPVPTRFNLTAETTVPAASRPDWATVSQIKLPREYTAPKDWLEVSFEDLQQGLANQKARDPRIKLPPQSRFEKLPPDVQRQAKSIVWMTVSVGYQPEMTNAWFAAFRQFQQEGRTHPVFSSSLFWVVTRANDCFY